MRGSFDEVPVSLFANWTFQSLLFIALMGVLAFLCRRASAAQRHLLWRGTFLATLCLPFLSVGLSRWSVSPLPIELPVSVDAPVAVGIGEESAAEKSSPEPAPTFVASATPRSARWETPSLSETLVGAWLCGVALCGARHAASLLALRRLRSRCRPANDSGLMEQAERAAQEMQLRLRPTLLQPPTREAIVPMTWGVRNPVVALPAEASGWAAELQSAALRHEYAHLRRNDWLWLQLARWVCVLCWFQPWVWFALRQLRHTAEQACDDLALDSGMTPTAYAAHLLAIIGQSRSARLTYAALTVGQPSALERRIRQILQATRHRRGVSRPVFALALMSLGCIVTFSALFTLIGSPLKATPALAQPVPAERRTARYSVGERKPTTPDPKFLQILDQGFWGATEVAYIRRRLKQGVDIQTRSPRGITTLMLAAKAGDLAMMRQALDGGVEVNAQTKEGYFALTFVMSSRNDAKVRLLLQAGADVHARDLMGRTPLMWAAEFKYRNGMNLLLDAGADINARNKKGYTALVYAEGHPGLVRLLNARGLKE